MAGAFIPNLPFENMKPEEAFEPSEPPFEFVKLRNIPLLEENKIISEIPAKDVIFDESKTGERQHATADKSIKDEPYDRLPVSPFAMPKTPR
ncbi:MAG TPA: hypothetical protein VIL74_11335 [Pyrinomonadaceae bacterium]|jgi:hypothetical protein